MMKAKAIQATLVATLSASLSLAGCEALSPADGGCGCEGEALSLNARSEALAIAGRWQPSASAEQRGQTADVPITEAGPWRGEAVSCSGTFTEGAQAVREWVFAHWPQVTDVQGYSCRPINGNANSTSIHAVGRALDIFIPLDEGEADNELGDPLANYLMEHAEEMGIQRVIWDRTIWTAGRASYEYGGAHPHHDHLHIELSVPGGERDAPFFRDGLPAPTFEPCAPPLEASGGVIDSESSCLSLYGQARFWRSVEGQGYGGSLYWTNAFENESPSNSARWRFSVSQSGTYELAVHSVAEYSVHEGVRYEIHSAEGVTPIRLNIAGQDGWVRLGEARFEAGAGEYFVELFDNYDAPPGPDPHIIVDALKISSTSPPVDPPPVGGESPVGGEEGPDEEGGADEPAGGDGEGEIEPPSPPLGGASEVSGGAPGPAGRPIPEREPEEVVGGTDNSLPWEQPSAQQSSGAAGCDQRGAERAPLLALLVFIGALTRLKRTRARS